MESDHADSKYFQRRSSQREEKTKAYKKLLLLLMSLLKRSKTLINPNSLQTELERRKKAWSVFLLFCLCCGGRWMP
jgi:hypothetical protein